MNISWYGLSSFKIGSRDLTIITDPFGSQTGLSAVRGNADIVVCSNPKSELCNNFSSIGGQPFIIDGPGEYDIKSAAVLGAAAENRELGSSAIYSIETEDIRIAFLGPVTFNALSDSQKELFEGADIVLIGVGDKHTLSFDQAAKIATGLEPFIIIPHSYKIPSLDLPLDKLDKFLQEMGGKAEELDKLTVKKKELAGESTKLVVLTPQR
jgi:L-ascorbate metabolism protein UlaG (beta-lactamase superfamily)